VSVYSEVFATKVELDLPRDVEFGLILFPEFFHLAIIIRGVLMQRQMFVVKFEGARGIGEERKRKVFGLCEGRLGDPDVRK